MVGMAGMKEEMAKLQCHGVRTTGNGRPSLDFGFLRLAEWLRGTFRNRLVVGQARPEWPEQWFDAEFDRACTSLRATLFKFDRVANKLGHAIDRFQHSHRSQTVDGVGLSMSALEDIPLYLDLIFLYLRMEADYVATMIPCFWGSQGRNVPRRDFRTQLEWFIKNGANFDKEYTRILTEENEWERRGRDLRNVVVHRRGGYQLGYLEDLATGEIELHASLVGDSGFIDENLVPSVRGILAGWFKYLDGTFEHFYDRFREQFGAQTVPQRGEWLHLYVVEGREPAGFGLYPRIPDPLPPFEALSRLNRPGKGGDSAL
jgi:hypothetical protein